MRVRCATSSWPLVLALVGAGCAGSGPRAARDFARSDLATIPLRSLALAVVVAEPAALSGAEIDVEPFRLPQVDATLDGGRPGRPDLAGALAASLERELRGAGYELRAAPAARTLDELRSRVEADGLLVVRAVPIDRIYALSEDTASQVIVGDQGTQGVLIPRRIVEARLVPGRIFLSQIFLFDARTGARLWSRQLPGFPRDGKLRVDGPLFAHGVTGASAEGLEPEVLTTRASDRLTSALLEGFPAPRPGTPEGRARLVALDVESEVARETFFDSGHLVVEVGSGWTFERVETELRLPDGTSLPDLGTGALAPSGALQLLQPRVTYVAPGGFSFSAFGTFGTIPGRFERSLFRSSGRTNVSDTLGAQSIQGGSVFGGGLGVGHLFAIAPSLFLHPSVLGLIEQWNHDVQPGLTVGDRVRVGGEVRVDLMLFVARPLYVRLGAHARLGADTEGPPFVGGGGSLGVGALF